MRATPLDSRTALPRRSLKKAQQDFERLQPSPWGGPVTAEKVVPRVLPHRYGDGRQAMLLSFYGAPEVVILVLVDSALPGDLPTLQRGMPGAPPSFRDLTDEIEELCRETWDEPKAGEYRLSELKQKQEQWDGDPEDLPCLWLLVFEDGCTWTHAATPPGTPHRKARAAGRFVR